MRIKFVLSAVFLVLAIIAATIFMTDLGGHDHLIFSLRSLLFIMLLAVFLFLVIGILLLSFFSRTRKHDLLTHLPNRTLFFAKLKDYVKFARLNKRNFAVVYIDLDNFKSINDSYGHEVGDKLLQVVSKRIATYARSCDLVARIGGDSFAITLTRLTSSEIDDIICRMQLTLGASYNVGYDEVRISASIGVSRFPDDANGVFSLIKYAEVALYAAKEHGRNNCQYFTKQLMQRRMHDVYIENALPFAMDRNEFYIVYQPQLRLSDLRVVGMEVLLRWRHPELGLVSPAKFIPIAEKMGLIAQISEWVIMQACKQYSEWLSKYKCISTIIMSINLSPRQLLQMNFADRIIKIAQGFSVCASNIHFEITENAVIANLSVAKKILRLLTEHGFRIVIDDFGTGYSSISYLKNLSIVAVKIDRSFIINVLSNSDDAVIVRSTIDMANGLGIGVIAEGVETKGQIDFFRSYDVIVQGFYFSEPLIGAEMERFILNRS